jgi:hypothetical protein
MGSNECQWSQSLTTPCNGLNMKFKAEKNEYYKNIEVGYCWFAGGKNLFVQINYEAEDGCTPIISNNADGNIRIWLKKGSLMPPAYRFVEVLLVSENKKEKELFAHSMCHVQQSDHCDTQIVFIPSLTNVVKNWKEAEKEE